VFWQGLSLMKVSTNFKDAVLYQASCYAGVDRIVTRNTKDFRAAVLFVFSLEELWQQIQKNIN